MSEKTDFPTKEEMIEELTEFVVGQRKAQEKFWWVGEFDPETKSPTLVSTSLRGFLEKNMWLPLEDEIGGCCDELVSRSKAESLNDSFEFMRHCMTPEHVREMLSGRSQDQLEAEYNFMLEQVMESLVNSF
jgi:hypothetical protein